MLQVPNNTNESIVGIRTPKLREAKKNTSSQKRHAHVYYHYTTYLCVDMAQVPEQRFLARIQYSFSMFVWKNTSPVHHTSSLFYPHKKQTQTYYHSDLFNRKSIYTQMSNACEKHVVALISTFSKPFSQHTSKRNATP